MATPNTHQSTSESDTRNTLKRIILMGATGTGKSTFISNILDRDIGIGHELKSCTKQIQEYETMVLDETVFLVDTPGFDDSDVPDIIILQRISDWLKTKAVRDSAIAGVIYLHKISDTRMSGSAKRNLKTFQALCGDEFSPRIVVATTHWADKDTTRHGQEEERESAFKTTFWKDLISNHAQIKRLEFSLSDHPFAGNTINPVDARQILETILNVKRTGHEFLMRVEVVDQKKKVRHTTAAHVVEDSITERISALEMEKKQLKKVKGDTTAEQQEIKGEVRILKANRAKLRGNLFGMFLYGK